MKKIKITLLIAVIAAAGAFSSMTNLFASAGDEMVTLTGKFTDITRPNVTFKTNDGITYHAHIGPYWYWEDNNFSINTDAETELYGKIDGSTNEIYVHSLKYGNVTIKLVDDNGNPLWWNNGKGKNRNNDWGSGNFRGQGKRGNCQCRRCN